MNWPCCNRCWLTLSSQLKQLRKSRNNTNSIQTRIWSVSRWVSVCLLLTTIQKYKWLDKKIKKYHWSLKSTSWWWNVKEWVCHILPKATKYSSHPDNFLKPSITLTYHASVTHHFLSRSKRTLTSPSSNPRWHLSCRQSFTKSLPNRNFNTTKKNSFSIRSIRRNLITKHWLIT